MSGYNRQYAEYEFQSYYSAIYLEKYFWEYMYLLQFTFHEFWLDRAQAHLHGYNLGENADGWKGKECPY